MQTVTLTVDLEVSDEGQLYVRFGDVYEGIAWLRDNGLEVGEIRLTLPEARLYGIPVFAGGDR